MADNSDIERIFGIISKARDDIAFVLTDQVPPPDHISEPLWGVLNVLNEVVDEMRERYDLHYQDVTVYAPEVPQEE